MCHTIQDKELNELKTTNEKRRHGGEEQEALGVNNRSWGGHKAMPGSKQRGKTTGDS